jgi:hypothetical protein
VETVFDWVTVAIFAGLIVLFLQRSSGESEPQDHIWQYLVAAVGCAVTNYLGNGGLDAAEEGGAYDYVQLGGAVLVLAATLAFVWIVLKPFKRG